MGRTSKSSNASSTAQEHDSDPTEFVSMATFNEMMKMQERMLKTMFESVLSSVNTRIDEVVKSVAELKTSLQYSQRDIDDLMESTDELAMIEDELEDIQYALNKHEDKMEYLENQSRRNNIRIDGIAEVGNETWSDTEEKAKQILKEKLNLDCEPEIERANNSSQCGGWLKNQIKNHSLPFARLETERRDPSCSHTNQANGYICE